jgi:hypothetical protein
MSYPIYSPSQTSHCCTCSSYSTCVTHVQKRFKYQDCKTNKETTAETLQSDDTQQLTPVISTPVSTFLRWMAMTSWILCCGLNRTCLWTLILHYSACGSKHLQPGSPSMTEGEKLFTVCSNAISQDGHRKYNLSESLSFGSLRILCPTSRANLCAYWNRRHDESWCVRRPAYQACGQCLPFPQSAYPSRYGFCNTLKVTV